MGTKRSATELTKVTALEALISSPQPHSCYQKKLFLLFTMFEEICIGHFAGRFRRRKAAQTRTTDSYRKDSKSIPTHVKWT
jgi:hypothetical protein